ncbi:hypothetical protein WISP_75203 [Willisornis vidua]|uniref:Uncharacterized protein n=1 Tax=Willisornis vidua TaxID=1566151 RepID=A0ABQ9DC98_9PASS|nr:hypothetical protein WISP_75203 [Willisornis vidua]
MSSHSFCKELLPNVQPKPPLAQLKTLPSCPTAGHLGEETNPCLAPASFQGVVGRNEDSPEPPLLQAKHPQLPQPFLTGPVLQSLHQSCPSLDPLQHLNVLPKLRGSELGTALAMWPHQCQVKRKNHCPGPAGHTVPDKARTPLAFLATRAHCWLMFSFLSIRTPRSISAWLLSSHSVPSDSIQKASRRPKQEIYNSPSGKVEKTTVPLDYWETKKSTLLHSSHALKVAAEGPVVQVGAM